MDISQDVHTSCRMTSNNALRVALELYKRFWYYSLLNVSGETERQSRLSFIVTLSECSYKSEGQKKSWKAVKLPTIYALAVYSSAGYWVVLTHQWGLSNCDQTILNNGTWGNIETLRPRLGAGPGPGLGTGLL